MTGRRVERVQDLIREEISRLLLYKVKDPRLSSVNITGIKMTGDLKKAVLYYSILDDSLDRGQVQESLVKASGFFRREIGRVIRLKFVPEIGFQFDKSLDYALHIEKLLGEIRASSKGNEDEKV
jgi:ribosome-binding factor A